MQIGSKEWSDLIIEGARAFDIDLTPDHTSRFAIHATELIRWNQKINLTAITDPLEVAVKHFLDSLPAVRFMPPNATLLDIGSGGGFPGLPLKVLRPSLSITLIDASLKKVNFLKHVIRTLKLGSIKALHMRAEDLAAATKSAKRFDVIISRAFSSLEHFFKLALPLLAEEGSILAFKGEVEQDELKDSKNSIFKEVEDNSLARHQFSIAMEKFHLPFLNSKRSIVILKKKHLKFISY
jgi:16S rRNA (guanine527-N7)-methyltransferase